MDVVVSGTSGNTSETWSEDSRCAKSSGFGIRGGMMNPDYLDGEVGGFPPQSILCNLPIDVTDAGTLNAESYIPNKTIIRVRFMILLGVYR